MSPSLFSSLRDRLSSGHIATLASTLLPFSLETLPFKTSWHRFRVFLIKHSAWMSVQYSPLTLKSVTVVSRVLLYGPKKGAFHCRLKGVTVSSKHFKAAEVTSCNMSVMNRAKGHLRNCDCT